MSFPFENFHWALVPYDPLYGRKRYGVLVHPNQAKIIDLTTSFTVDLYTGPHAESRAIDHCKKLLENWDKHIYCCWSPDDRTNWEATY